MRRAVRDVAIGGAPVIAYPPWRPLLYIELAHPIIGTHRSPG
jgi:hypothetical protein